MERGGGAPFGEFAAARTSPSLSELSPRGFGFVLIAALVCSIFPAGVPGKNSLLAGVAVSCSLSRLIALLISMPNRILQGDPDVQQPESRDDPAYRTVCRIDREGGELHKYRILFPEQLRPRGIADRQPYIHPQQDAQIELCAHQPVRNPLLNLTGWWLRGGLCILCRTSGRPW